MAVIRRLSENCWTTACSLAPFSASTRRRSRLAAFRCALYLSSSPKGGAASESRMKHKRKEEERRQRAAGQSHCPSERPGSPPDPSSDGIEPLMPKGTAQRCQNCSVSRCSTTLTKRGCSPRTSVPRASSHHRENRPRSPSEIPSDLQSHVELPCQKTGVEGTSQLRRLATFDLCRTARRSHSTHLAIFRTISETVQP